MQSDKTKWKARDDTVYDTKWMDSVHLAHSFNLLLRRLSPMILGSRIETIKERSDIYDEVARRGLLEWQENSTDYQIRIPEQRETVAQLAYWHAIFENINATSYRYRVRFRDDMNATIDEIVKKAQSGSNLEQKIVQRAAKHRLGRS